jgi:excisionase family DNA binding protein
MEKAAQKTEEIDRENDKLLRVSTVAKRLDCTNRYVYILCDMGRLDSIRLGHKYGIRIFENSLKKLINQEEIANNANSENDNPIKII